MTTLVTPPRTQQSPIKIVTAASYYAPELKPLGFHYARVGVTHVGHELIVDRGSGAYCLFEGMQCPLRKLHFHAPAEHRIDGPAAELEVHLVHEIPDYPERHASAYLVVGVIFTPEPDASKSRAAPVSLEHWLARHVGARRDGADPAIDPNAFLPADRDYFRYEGSLTTGAYDELVSWVVLRDPAQGPAPKALKLEPESSRLVQPLARRFVLRSFVLP